MLTLREHIQSGLNRSFLNFKIVQEVKPSLMYHCPLHLAVNFSVLKMCFRSAALYCHVHVL